MMHILYTNIYSEPEEAQCPMWSCLGNCVLRKIHASIPEAKQSTHSVQTHFEWALHQYFIQKATGEILAVVGATHQLQHYLCGVHFLIHTDHAALKWLLSFKDPKGQVAWCNNYDKIWQK